MWRLADGTPVGEPLTGHDGAVDAVALEALRDGTPVIVSGGDDGTVRVWRLADGTPVIVNGRDDGTVRVWRLKKKSASVGEQLTGHDGAVNAVAVRALADDTPVVVSGGDDGTVRVWRLADGTPLGPPLTLPGSVRHFAVHGDVIVTATGTDIAVHQPALLPPLLCV